MKIELWSWNHPQNWFRHSQSEKIEKPDLVLFFFGSRIPEIEKRYQEIRSMFPESYLAGCSTSGEILEEDLIDDSISLIAIQFATTKIQTSSVKRGENADSYKLGKELIETLPKEDLSLLMLLSIGHNINGAELVLGIRESLSVPINIFGGLAGDGPHFEKTFVCANSKPDPDHILAIGFYGNSIKSRCGSFGGWHSFGPKRKISKSKENVLFELDGKPALELYKSYLGDESVNLPGSALLFPLQIFPENGKGASLVRTILSINESDNSMTFAGNIPQNHYAQLMTASFENLIDGAESAAEQSKIQTESESFAILISCVGRKLVLGQRTVEEIEAVRSILGQNCRTIGFYSYGEISPGGELLNCELHNQTMTITHIYET